jgi:hypothetical protein
MNSKKYIILWEKPDKYWQGDGRVGDRDTAKCFKLTELPEKIQERNLYRIGGIRAPMCWKYVSTCGSFASVEEK